MTWVAVLFGLAGAALLALAPYWGPDGTDLVWAAQASWVLGNAIWLAEGLATHRWPQVAMFAGYLLLAVLGVATWS